MLFGLRGAVGRALPPVPALDRRSRWALGLVVAAGAVARLGWAIGAAWRPISLRDPALYLILSEQVANGEGYVYPGRDGGVTAFYPPGYSVALGVVQWLARLLPGELSAFGVAVGFNVVLSVLTIVLVFELGRRLLSVPVGLVAAAAFAFWPNLIVHSGLVLTETLFLFLFVAMLLLALATPAVARAPGRGRMLAVGVLFGTVGMVRPTSLVMAPVFLVLWWPQGVGVALKRTALVGLGTLALVLPWTVRNAVRMDSFVLISTNMGDNICIGNHPDASGNYEVPDPPCNLGMPPRVVGPRPGSEIERQNDNFEIAWRSVRDDPLDFVARMPARLRYTLDRDSDGLWGAADYGARPLWSSRRYEAAKGVADIYYYAVGAVGVVGAILLLRGPDAGGRRLFLVLTAVAQLISPLVTFGDPRFKIPLYPALAIGAAYAVTTAWSSWIRRRAPAEETGPPSGLGEDRRVPAGAPGS